MLRDVNDNGERLVSRTAHTATGGLLARGSGDEDRRLR
jgi:hypothetical protein